MENRVINEAFERYRTEVTSWLDGLFALTGDMEDNALAEVVGDIRRNVNEPFLFVVVGEIKAGKSSFINALLETDICRVDPAPCTDSIQQIVYSAEKTVTEIALHHRKIGLPAEVLRHISIVDTPGANTVIDHHEALTQKYIPNSGLVIFVFPAKNPHTKTAWDLLDFISDAWRKRVIFVLQQADLATENELLVNTAKVREYAEKRGLHDPLIFTVSAKWEKNKDPRSGFEQIRAHIRETVTGGRHLYLKLSTTLASGEQALKKVHDALQEYIGRLETDRIAAGRISGHLNAGKTNMDRVIAQFVDASCERYDRIGLEIRSDFEEGLSVVALYKRAIRGTLSRKNSLAAWLEALQTHFESQLSQALVNESGEWSWQFMQTIQDLVVQIDEALRQTVSFGGGGRKGVWDEKQLEIVSDIRKRVSLLGARDLFHETLAANPAAMPSRLISGSTLTLLGALLLTTHVTLLDITGGILAGLGVFITGGVLVAKRGKLLREFAQAVENGRSEFRRRLIAELTERFAQIHLEISANVSPFLVHIEEADRRLAQLMAQGQALQHRLQALKQRMDNDMKKGA